MVGRTERAHSTAADRWRAPQTGAPGTGARHSPYAAGSTCRTHARTQTSPARARPRSLRGGPSSRRDGDVITRNADRAGRFRRVERSDLALARWIRDTRIVNLSRLMVLGLLDSQGALHGHQIKLIARDTEVAQWGGIGIGALYRELRVLGDEGLVRAVAVEQVGRRPVRTVYEITDAGRRELRGLRERAICELRFGPDPLAVALLFGRVGDPAELAGYLARRREVLAATIADLDAERGEHLAQGRIGALDSALFLRQVRLLEAEMRWLDEFRLILTSKEEQRDDR
ncbi:hypothetical protein C6361_06145 [Plantactinospora sp. BC1]|nr:hypothetical protein C6361_06145 [Plantactinospora sp. BC1]